MPHIVVSPGSPEERVYEVEGVMSIGRASENQIPVLHKSLSRVHARIEVANGTVTLRDCKSTNGTHVNGARIESCRLYHGDAIRCGDVLMTFVEEPKILKEIAIPGASLSLEEIVNIETDKIDTPTGSVLGSPQGGGSRERLRILLKVSEILSSPEPIEALLRKILDLLFQIMEVDRAAILIVDEQTGRLESRVVRTGRGQEAQVASIPAPVSRPPARRRGETEEVTLRMAPKAAGDRDAVDEAIYSRHIVNYVMQKSVAVLTADAPTDARFGAAESILEQSIRASMGAPLRAGDRTIGVLYVDNVSRPDRYTGEDLEFLSAFANQAAVAIENARLYRKIEEEAILRNNFLRFFPPATIRRIMATKDLGLGAIETEVTALFCDISSFTEMSSRMSPREIVDLLNEYFPAMADVVFRHEGTLEKYIGDALLAVWGAPFQHEDDVDRAVRAAIEMQRTLDRLNAKWSGKRELHIHIGLNTGRVAAGNIGSEQYIQYATIGDATNVASRICGVAGAGEILVSESTYAKCRNVTLPFERLDPVKVKGKGDPLVLYRLDWRREVS